MRTQFEKRTERRNASFVWQKDADQRTKWIMMVGAVVGTPFKATGD